MAGMARVDEEEAAVGVLEAELRVRFLVAVMVMAGMAGLLSFLSSFASSLVVFVLVVVVVAVTLTRALITAVTVAVTLVLAVTALLLLFLFLTLLSSLLRLLPRLQLRRPPPSASFISCFINSKLASVRFNTFRSPLRFITMPPCSLSSLNSRLSRTLK